MPFTLLPALRAEPDISELPRVALVIGVQNYNPRYIRKLKRVEMDVNALVHKLKTRGGFREVSGALGKLQHMYTAFTGHLVLPSREQE